jgi:hypothetical protein
MPPPATPWPGRHSARLRDHARVTESIIASRVLDKLRRCDVAVDDELARRLGVIPQQTIN